MDRATLVNRVAAGYAGFVERLSRATATGHSLSLETSDDPTLDLLNHILVHQERMLTWLEESLSAGQPLDTQPYDMPEPELDALNERIKLEGRGRSARDLAERLDQVHQRVLSFVESASVEFLFDAQRWHLRGGEPLWMAVAANTYEHYDEHARELGRAA